MRLQLLKLCCVHILHTSHSPHSQSPALSFFKTGPTMASQQPLKRKKIEKSGIMNEGSPRAASVPSAPSADARPSSSPSVSQPKINMPFPCPPNYQLPTVTQEVRQVPIPKAESPAAEPPVVAKEFPLGSTSSTRTRALKPPKMPPVPKSEPPPPNNAQSYPPILNSSPSQPEVPARPTRPVPVVHGIC